MRLVLTLLLAAAALQDPIGRAQDRDLLVAFRFDTQHAVATVKSELTVSLPQLARDPVPQPLAKYGYPIFDLPPDLQKLVPSRIRSGDRWTLHTGPGQVFGATAERIVLGEGQCSHMIGVLLKVDDKDSYAFAGVRAKYYAAERGSPPGVEASAPALGEMPASTLTPEVRAVIERALGGMLTRELPAVRAAGHAGLARAASGDAGYQRAWARRVLEAQEALARGAGTLSYDAQPYHLTPDGALLIFVRAIWRVGAQQGFAAAAWIRSDTGEIVWRNLRPAEWIAMGEFSRGVSSGHLGLVLNVVDRDGDGWGEVVFAQPGYEGVGVSLLDARSGFTDAATGYTYGC